MGDRKGGDARVPLVLIPTTRRGAASPTLLLVAVLGVLLLLAAALLFLHAPSRDGADDAPGRSDDRAADAEGSAPGDPETPAREPSGPGGREEPAGSFPPPGKGRLRVFILDPPTEARRADCTVTIGPTGLLLAPRAPEERTAILPPGTKACAFENLPDAGYLVRASSEGLSGESAPVEIGPAGRDVAVRLALRSAGLVDGAVFDADGIAVEGVAVALEAEAPGIARRESASDASGRYRFEGVHAGPYRVVAGPSDSPLVPAVRLDVREGPLRHDVHLPPLGALEIAVVDADGRPVVAALQGFGRPAGSFRGETSAEGLFVALHLPPGDWSVRIRAAGHEIVYGDARVAARERANLRVTLRASR